MFKVVCVVDKEGTALDRLAKGVAKYHDNIEYHVLAIHPKRPEEEQLRAFFEVALTADVIDWQYCRTSEMMLNKYSDMLSSQRHILTHNNPYSIHESDWNEYHMVVGNNKEIYDALGKVTESQVEYVPLAVDTDFWTFNPDYHFGGIADSWKRATDLAYKPSVIMVANRIESKKGILPVAKACQKLGIKMILVGSISDGDYFREVMNTGVIHFHEKVTNEQLRDLYYEASLHVCNSVDNFESGTMPILEAMLCGTPVLTRKVGHVPELNTNENMVIHYGSPDDVEKIAELIDKTIRDKKRLMEMRDKAWQTAKARSFERRAYLYQKLYREVMHPLQTQAVSVVVPVYDKPELYLKTLNAIANQTYKNIELIVVDDMNYTTRKELRLEGNREIVAAFAQYVNFPVRYIYTAGVLDDYGLARARNTGTIEATGDVMIYCDQRMVMKEDAIEQFLAAMKPKYWLYGNKGGKKDFVENFSAAYRTDVINAGMFCERMDVYGGMSQELRYRLRNQGLQTEYVEKAEATAVGKSGNRSRKRADIIRMKNRLFKMGLEA